MNMFKLQNGDIINLDYVKSIENPGAARAPDNYRIYLRGNSIVYISKQDYDDLCTRFFSPNK